MENFKPELVLDSSKDDDTVIAQVHGEPYTKGDYTTYRDLKRILPAGAPEEEALEKIKNDLTNTILLPRVVAHVARKEGYDQIPYYRYASRATRTQKVSQVWLNRKMEEYLKNHPVSEDEKREFYEANQNRFLEPQKIHAAVIGISLLPRPERDV